MGRKRALLCGLNYLKSRHQLRGCVNDVMLMSDILSRKFGFNAKNKRMLTNKSATTANILERLEWLVDGAAPGDVLYFHYSGHGSQAVDTKYDDDHEPDGLDEVLVPDDMDWRKKMIRDDDLKKIFDKVPNGVHLTAVLDCCHSGSAMDHGYSYRPKGIARGMIEESTETPNKSRWVPMPEDIANRGIGLDLKVKAKALQSKKGANKTGVMISGCQSHQTSADAWIHTKFMGACTYYLNEVLEEHDYRISYKALVDKLNNKMKKFGYSQRPECNYANPSHLQMNFLG